MNVPDSNMTRRRVLGAAAAFGAGAYFTRGAGAEGAKMPWTRRGIQGCGDSFRFAVVADRTNSARDGVFEKAMRQLECLRPDFVISVGDFVQGYHLPEFKPVDDPAVARARRQEVDALIRKLSMPFFLTPGNHDINHDVSCGMWTELYGQRWHAFAHEDVLFLGLDSQGGDGYKPGLGGKQLAWAADTLSTHKSARWIFITLHQPLWQYGGKHPKAFQEFGKLEKLLAGRRYTGLAGHHHRYQHQKRNNMDYIKLATTGGQSQLRGPQFGEFDHIMLVTMTQDAPSISNVMLDGILGTNGKPLEQP